MLKIRLSFAYVKRVKGQKMTLIEGTPLWPFGPPSVMHLLRRSARRSATSWATTVTTGLTVVQYAALIVVAELETCDQQTLGNRVGIDKATGTYLVDRMIETGLIATRTDPENRRRKLISLTPAGERILQATIPEARQAHAMMTARLTESELAHLIHLLSRLAGVTDPASERLDEREAQG